MSEVGWRRFLAADGRGDWAVLHGGAAAVFRIDGLVAGAALAARIAEVAPESAPQLAITLTERSVGVRLTRDLWMLEDEHLELARAVSRVAAEAGAVADLSAVQEVQLAVSAHPDEIDLPFWRAVLGYDPLADDNGVDPLGHGSTVWMQPLDAGKPLRHAMHVDVSVARGQVAARLEAALAAGGRIVDESDAPAHWVLSDRAGNKVCVCAWPDGSDQPGLGGGDAEGNGRGDGDAARAGSPSSPAP